jgi:hypothetical protein
MPLCDVFADAKRMQKQNSKPAVQKLKARPSRFHNKIKGTKQKNGTNQIKAPGKFGVKGVHKGE